MPVHTVEARKPGRLSLCMIVRNEERTLDRCLSSVASLVDELCIVDTGSTDRTEQIAHVWNAKVGRFPWTQDFSAARNAALDLATCPWVLSLDADERLTPESVEAIRAVVEEEPDGSARFLRCISATGADGHGAPSQHLTPRLFPRTKHVRWRDAIHEYLWDDQAKVALGGSAIPDAVILHDGYALDGPGAQAKAKRNTDIAVKALESDPHDSKTWFALGQARALCGDIAGSRASYERMIAEAPEDCKEAFFAYGVCQLAQMYVVLGDQERAQMAALDCLDIVPGCPDALFVLGQARRLAGRPEDALVAFEELLDDGRRGPSVIGDVGVIEWKARVESGLCHEACGRYEDAERFLVEALARRPSLHVAIEAANFYLRRQQIGDAVSLLYGAAYRAYTEPEATRMRALAEEIRATTEAARALA